MLKSLRKEGGFATVVTLIILVLAIVGLFALCGRDANATHREECVTVVDEEAWTEVIPGTPSQHYSYVGGPIEGTPAPPPAEGWQANTEQEPPGHLNSTNAPDGGPYTGSGLHYASHGNSGLADWFYFDPGTPDTVIEHDAVTHEECEPVKHSPKPDEPKEPPKDVDGPKNAPKPPKDLAFTGPMSMEVAAIAAVSLLILGAGAYLVSRKLNW